MGELSVSDLVLILVIGEAMNSLILEDNKFMGVILYIIFLSGANYLIEHVVYTSKKFRKLMEGDPVILIRNGKILQKNLDK